MMELSYSRSAQGEALGETNMNSFYVHVTATPNAHLRFWIISMMLVLIGLASLKIR
jgi:UDP-N-acetylmuramyl pentapeptide phosphotransferase/UDP-N-acetylglucosamine-1-phosphate transferase